MKEKLHTALIQNVTTELNIKKVYFTLQCLGLYI